MMTTAATAAMGRKRCIGLLLLGVPRQPPPEQGAGREGHESNCVGIHFYTSQVGNARGFPLARVGNSPLRGSLVTKGGRLLRLALGLGMGLEDGTPLDAAARVRVQVGAERQVGGFA